jgi:hypothetical protein
VTIAQTTAPSAAVPVPGGTAKLIICVEAGLSSIFGDTSEKFCQKL